MISLAQIVYVLYVCSQYCRTDAYPFRPSMLIRKYQHIPKIVLNIQSQSEKDYTED